MRIAVMIKKITFKSSALGGMKKLKFGQIALK